MDIRSRNEDVSPQLLDLISKDTGWPKSSEEKKLELRLGPPGEDWSLNNNIKNLNTETREESLLSLGYFSAKLPSTQNPNNKNGCQSQSQKLSTSERPNGSIMSSTWVSSSGYQGLNQQNHQSQPKASSFLDLHSNAENKVFSPSSAAKTAVTSSSQKRTAPGPVVGWPPLRSFRKNIASSSSSKPPSESQHQQDKFAGKKPVDNSSKGLFVKINMDGVPIGRKVDLNAYDSYEKLSSAVDQLFRGLLAAQRDSCAGGIQNKQEEEKAITGSLDGNGEYTLVYEDNEGDRMLVGDVPWHMFVSTVKRLRVLKSSELSAFTIGSKQDKIPLMKQ